MSTAAEKPAGAPALPERLVLFDGLCGFCDRAVRWLVERDPEGRLRFAPLQGEVAAALRARHPEIPAGVEALVYVETGEGAPRVHLRSAAALRALAAIDPGHRLLVLARLPSGLTDLGYRLFARLRYRLFGRLAACRVPSPAERERFLP